MASLRTERRALMVASPRATVAHRRPCLAKSPLFINAGWVPLFDMNMDSCPWITDGRAGLIDRENDRFVGNVFATQCIYPGPPRLSAFVSVLC